MNPELPENPSKQTGGDAMIPQDPLAPGSVPAGLDYEVISLIGRGGYGEVWLVRDQQGVYFACKVIYRASFDNDRPYEREYDGIKKFEPVSRNEASQVKILHVGRRDQAGYFYYILELADDANAGRQIDPRRYVPKTLRSELIRQRRLPLSECLQIGLSLTAAVEHLHRNGLIHRDIKPGNVIFVNGLPKLADIGLVTDVNVSISYVGTEGYIPPEGPTSPQADVYGLGKVLYEISTGKDRLDFPDLPTDLGDAEDRRARLEFNAVVVRACEGDLARRYRSARELHSDLALLQSGGSVRGRRARKQRWRLAGRMAALLALGLMLVGGLMYLRGSRYGRSSDTDENPRMARVPLPPNDEVERIQGEIRANLKSRLSDARPAAKAALAKQLIQESATTSDSARELADLRVASSLAKEAADYPLAMLGCDKMAERFNLDAIAMKTELLTNRPSNIAGSEAASLAEVAVATGFDALGVDDYEHGRSLADLAKSNAIAAGNSRLQQQADFLGGEIGRCGTAFSQTSKYRDALRKNPGDPEANLAVGQFLCFVKNDWQTGLPMMAHGNDDRLKRVLDVEINKKPERVNDLVAAGDLWWSLGADTTNETKGDFQRRARYWYRKAVGRVRNAADKEELKRKFADRLNIFPPASAEIHLYCRVAGTDRILFTSDETRWTSGRPSQSGRVNQVQIGAMKPSSELKFKNSGATLLLPQDLDFSTARIEVDHAPKQHFPKLDAGADHAQITLVHTGRGMASFELTLTFGDRR